MKTSKHLARSLVIRVTGPYVQHAVELQFDRAVKTGPRRFSLDPAADPPLRVAVEFNQHVESQ